MAADELSQLNLSDDFQEAAGTPDAARWRLEMPATSSGLEVWCTMHSSQAPDEQYQARLLWNSYPGEAPSLKFRDPETGRLELRTAWPIVRGFRPASLDACVNYCIEGLNLHPEWKKDPRYAWNPTGNPLLKVLRILQQELDEQYGGRFK